MKNVHPFLSVILMVTLLELVFIENAISEDNSCYLKSKTANLHASQYVGNWLIFGFVARYPNPRIKNSIPIALSINLILPLA